MPRKKKEKANKPELSKKDSPTKEKISNEPPLPKENVEKPYVHKARKLRPKEKPNITESKGDIPKAVFATRSDGRSSAVALVTKSKYIAGRWWHLIRNEQIVAPKVVIDSLINAGLAK
jgi:hypothetical protein